MAFLLRAFGIGVDVDSQPTERSPLRPSAPQSERIPEISLIVRKNLLNAIDGHTLTGVNPSRNWCNGYSTTWLVGASKKVYAYQGPNNCNWLIRINGVATQLLKNVKTADLPERCHHVNIEILRTDKPITDGNYFILSVDGTAFQPPFLDDLRKELNQLAFSADQIALKMKAPKDRPMPLWLQIFCNPEKYKL